MDLGRAGVVELPAEETARRWQATTPQWPIMHAVTYGVSRDQMMARHKSNHIQVAYATGPTKPTRRCWPKRRWPTRWDLKCRSAGGGRMARDGIEDWLLAAGFGLATSTKQFQIECRIVFGRHGIKEKANEPSHNRLRLKQDKTNERLRIEIQAHFGGGRPARGERFAGSSAQNSTVDSFFAETVQDDDTARDIAAKLFSHLCLTNGSFNRCSIAVKAVMVFLHAEASESPVEYCKIAKAALLNSTAF